MELPNLGKNCALRTCNRLDFLPVKCDACLEVFCIEHYRYETHKCEKSKAKDVQVPACPLCSQPVACKKQELPDIAVSIHIDQSCPQNDMIMGKNKKPKSNLQACTFKSCKQKDLIYLECSDCASKFCIKHRHPSDHSCPGPRLSNYSLAANWQNLKGSCSKRGVSSFDMIKNKAQQISKSGQAALNRITNNKMAPTTSNSSGQANGSSGSKRLILQGNLTEEEALNIALRESAQSGSYDEQDEDIALAKAIQQSEIEAHNQNMTNNKDTCVLS